MKTAFLRNDDRKHKLAHGYHLTPISQYQSVIAGRYLHLLADGQIIQARVTSVHSWKRRGHPRAGHTEIHLKFGLYQYLSVASDKIDDTLRVITLNGVVYKQYPTIADVPGGNTKEDLFKTMSCTFDYSLPQVVLNDMMRLSGLPYDAIRSFTVWAYPDGHKLSGVPVSCVEEIQKSWDKHFPTIEPDDE